jgi:HK97 gp10 family phage protein
MSIELDGFDQLQRKLDQLPDKLLKKVVRPAVTKSGRIVRKQMKANAPKEFGVLQKAFASKVKTYKAGNVVAIIGPKKNIVGTITHPSGRIEKRVPANYAHLVELGTTHSAPNPFMRRAYEQTKGQVDSKLQGEIWDGIKRLAK